MNPNDTAKTIPKMRTFATDLSALRSVSAGDQTIQKAPVLVKLQSTTDTGAIPPFHTFSNSHKATADNIAIPTKAGNETPTATISQAQQIISQSSTKSQTTTESLPAVVITDTKRNRFSLTQALGSSMTQWWHTKKEEARKRKLPKYTIASAERRKGVIQKATAKTGRESTADHEAVISRIKAAKQIPHTPVVPVATIVPHTITTAPTWESNTSQEPQSKKPIVGLVTQKIQKAEETVATSVVPLPESKPIISNHAVIETPVSKPLPKIISANVSENIFVPVPKILTIKHDPVVTSELKSAVAITPTPIVRENVAASLPLSTPLIISPSRPKITPAVPQTKPVAPMVASVPNNPIINTTAQAPVTTYPSVFESEYLNTNTIRPEAVSERRFAPPREPRRSFVDVITQTNQLVFISFGALLFVIVTGLGMRSYLQSTPAPLDTPLLTTDIATTFESSSVAPAPFLVYVPEDLFSELTNQISSTDELFEVTFISALTNTVVSPAEFFSFVNAPVVFDFKENVTSVTFGGYRGAPWITISILDKTTALGGMLQWESTMAANLSPIFGDATYTSQNKFGDGISDSNDVRILKNADGEEELVYGFINDTTIVITKNTSSFMNLASSF